MSVTKVAACIACILAGVGPGFAADAVPPATYVIKFQVGAGQPEELSGRAAPNTIASITRTGAVSTGLQYVGSALASSFYPLQVIAGAEADWFAHSSGVLAVTDSSLLTYDFQVEETAPAPVDVVPLLLRGSGEAFASTTSSMFGSADATALLDIPALGIFEEAQAVCFPAADGCAGVAQNGFQFNGSASVAVGQNIQISLQGLGDVLAVGSGVLPQAGNSRFQAVVDPVIQIDPSFPYANDFAIVVSPNLTSSAGAPEPSSLALCVIGLLALLVWPSLRPRGRQCLREAGAAMQGIQR